MPEFHVHITIETPESGNRYVEICRELDLKPLVITNHMWGSADYIEYVPSSKFTGGEKDAIREAARLTVELLRLGVKVDRAKIEGRPEDVSRPLYFETHLKVTNLPHAEHGAFSITNSGNIFLTIRRDNMYDVIGEADNAPAQIEAILLDTNPYLDDPWISQ